MSTEPLRPLADVERALEYRFADQSWLVEALTHASHPGAPSNERLEFLGDRVLGLLVAEMLLATFPDEPEGALAPRLNALVRKETLADVARELGLGAALRRAPGEEGRPLSAAVLADACEAVIAALYRDGGLDVVRPFVRRVFGPRLEHLTGIPRDPKTALQEWAQGEGRAPPHYRLLGREGPDHEPLFRVAVELEGFRPAVGIGATKRAAERLAADAFMAREGLGP